MADISINGKQYSGKSVVIRDGRVIIDGKESLSNDKVINIHIEGNVEKIDVDACEHIIVDGNVGEITTTSGDIQAKQVSGSIKTTSGDVTIEGPCGGSINTVSGDIKTESVAGNIKTVSGDVDYRVKK
jgi:DUF4097 and DUF4098 domain-containing protein YvlB